MIYKNIAILGADSLLGQALCRQLERDTNVSLHAISDAALNTFSPEGLTTNLRQHETELVLNAHHRGGGLGLLKDVPADLFMENIAIDIQFIPSCHKAAVRKYVNILPNCIYPNDLPVPYLESQLWQGLPESIVAPYALTKKLSLVQANAFKQQYDFHSISLIVTAVYGPNDNFHPDKSQVIPSMIVKFDRCSREAAASVALWGSGNATREFIYVDDAAVAILKAANEYDEPEPMNICSGEELRISDLAGAVAGVIGYTGKIEWDTSKPVGCLRKCLSAEKMRRRLRYTPTHSLEAGLKKTVNWYYANAKHR